MNQSKQIFEIYIEVLADILISNIFMDHVEFETIARILDIMIYEKNNRILFVLTAKIVLKNVKEFVDTIKDLLINLKVVNF